VRATFDNFSRVYTKVKEFGNGSHRENINAAQNGLWEREQLIIEMLPWVDAIIAEKGGWFKFSHAVCLMAVRHFSRVKGASAADVVQEFRKKYYDDNVKGMLEAARQGLEELEEDIAILNAVSNVVKGVPV
jgi:hypothetical protein